MSNTLQLVIDNQLGYELDETKHVDSLSEGGDDERVPSSVSLVHDYMSASTCESRGDVREYTVYPARTGMAP
jgi:hypothetical protein